MKYPDVKDVNVRDKLIQLDVVELVDDILKYQFSHILNQSNIIKVKRKLKLPPRRRQWNTAS